ncbi:hypothetical protein OC834_000775 [Tilletia horrida]|nr:hypothetical protein OC834_000775 [Tilletia horrida]
MSNGSAHTGPLSKVLILGTGGTIAGRIPEGNGSSTVSIEDLVDAIPTLPKVADCTLEQVVMLPSSAMTTEVGLQLVKRVNEAFAADSELAGIVITHGTDTLEETAFLLECTINDPRPVVIAASMRLAFSVSADGPANMLQAVTLAASPSARDRGILIVLNDRINSAYYTVKTNPRALETFQAPEAGYLGCFERDNRPRFWYAPSAPTGRRHFDVSNISKLPTVAILYAYQDMPPALLDATLETLKPKGLVIACEGNGQLDPSWLETLVKLHEPNAAGEQDSTQPATSSSAPGTVAVVRSTRTTAGTVSAVPWPLPFSAGSLNPPKAKIFLQLLLAQGVGLREIRKAMELA